MRASKDRSGRNKNNYNKSNTKSTITTNNTSTSNPNHSHNSNTNNGIVAPPKYPRRVHTIEYFGDIRHDAYHWLRERRNPEVRKLLQRENAYMESVYAGLGGHQLSRTLFNEMRARWKEEDASLPHREHNYWYYTRTIPNADYPLFCRRPVNSQTLEFLQEVVRLWEQDPSAPLPLYEDEIVYLDVNLLVRELRLNYVEIGDMEVSPDEKQLAVALDCSNGKEVYSIFIIEITDVNYAKWLQQQSPFTSSELLRTWAATMQQSGQSIYASPTLNLQSHRSPTTPSFAKEGCTTRRGVKKSTQKTNNNNNNKSVRHAVPTHKIIRKIDVFDASDEVMWLNSNALLYVGIDSKMRSCRVIYHDLTLPVHSEQADIVCYEETDESFWVSALCFSADDKFAMFTVASGNCTEVYVIPCDSGMKRFISGIPIVYALDEIHNVFKNYEDKNPDNKSSSRSSSVSSKKSIIRVDNTCPVYCFTERTAFADHDIDHHESLFGEGIGAWIIIMTNIPPTAKTNDFRVAYMLDEMLTSSCDNQEGVVLSSPSQWRPLFAYDSHICVEGVECHRDFLLFSVRRSAAATVLLLPLRILWDRWKNMNYTSSIEKDSMYSPLLSLKEDTLDLRRVACRPPSGTLSESRFSLAKLIQEQKQKNEGKKKEEEEEEEEEGELLGVTSCTGDISFDIRTWHIAVTHLTVPTIVLACTLEEEEEEEENKKEEEVINNNNNNNNNNNRDLVLCVKRLYDVVVNGVPYYADDYDAAVVWVPSDYAFKNDDKFTLSPLKESMKDANEFNFKEVVNKLEPLPTKLPSPVVRIPVYLCWKKSLLHRGTNPMYLTVYGSYGDCCEVEFEPERLVLLDRGFIWAAAAVRGGGELGIPWRDAGRALQRATSVNDFVSVAKYLQDINWCASGRLVTAGASAGGFVVTAAMNIAPSLQRGIVASVPFVDCLTTLLDADLPLTISEWEEFGNPREDVTAYNLLRAMSPMDNIPSSEKTLPHILFQTAWQDTRVGFWESLAFTARLRERAKCTGTLTNESSQMGKSLVLHYCDFGAGHSGASGRYQRLREIAREYAFALLIQHAEV